MALDDPALLGGDLAHDLYNEFLDRYDAGDDFEELDAWAESMLEYQATDDVSREIWATVLGKAFWEVGLLTESFQDAVEEIVAEGAGVRFWEQYGLGKKRQQVLDRLLRTIATPKTKPRPRKKYKLVKHLVYPVDTVLVYENNDGLYQAVIVALIEQHRGRCSYGLTPMTYAEAQIPTLAELQEGEVIGTKIGYHYPASSAKLEQPGIEAFWEDPYFAGFVRDPLMAAALPSLLQPACFILGLRVEYINHVEMLRCKTRFQAIGKLEIRKGFKNGGMIGHASDFAWLEERFRDIEDHIRVVRCLKIPLSRILA